MITTPLSPDYPQNLLNLDSPPASLYIKGTILPQDKKAIAVVGSRDVSEEGKQMAEFFVTEFIKNKITIVSGLARGVDTIAHQTALKNHGRTIAVLGGGVNVVYPPENKNLFSQIPKSGALVSQFEPDSRPIPKSFLIRNSLISGLSLAVLIVEAARRSGTLSTAAHAARQGREVFVLPFGDGAKYLLTNGATAVDNPKTIINYINNLL